MISNISPGDWESLSAYVDYRLSDSERTLLEGRLRVEPELQRALDEMRRIKAVAWYATRRRAPRNYTLSPRQVKARASSPLYPAFRLASVLASVLFAMVLVGDFLAGVTTGVPILARMAPPQAAEIQVMEMAMEAAVPAPMEAEVEPTAQPVDALSMAAPSQAPVESPEEEPPSPFLSESADVTANQAIPYPMSTQSVALEAGEEYGIGGGPAAKAAVTETPVPTETPTPTPTATPEPTTEPLPEAQAVLEQPQDQPPAQDAANAQTDAAGRALFTIPYVNRWVVWGLEGLLLALAGMALIAALLTRRLR